MNGVQYLVCWLIFLLVLGSRNEATGEEQLTNSSSIANRPLEVHSPFRDLVLDLEPFRRKIRDILDQFSTLNETNCAIPDGAIMFTMCNQHMMPLMVLREKIMEKAEVRTCLHKRMITVCLDESCQQLCLNHHLPNCVHIKMPETPLSGYGAASSAYHKWSYNFIVWMKYDLFLQALTVAKEFFYLDADVAIFNNPFPDTRFGRDQTGTMIEGTYDIMYQRERGMQERGCGGSVNGGVMYFRNSSGLHEELFPRFLKHRDEIVDVHGNDQDLIGMYVKYVRYCTLPVARFMGRCVSSQDQWGYDPGKVVTYHTNCVAGIAAKIQSISNFQTKHFHHRNAGASHASSAVAHSTEPWDRHHNVMYKWGEQMGPH